MNQTITGQVEIYAGSVKISDEKSLDRFARIPYDSIVLCLCRKKCKVVAVKMEKKACVEIFVDPRELLSDVSLQLRIGGMMKDCDYTQTTERGPFIKSVADSWQQEFRMYWPSKTKEVSVYIRPNTARLVDL